MILHSRHFLISHDRYYRETIIKFRYIVLPELKMSLLDMAYLICDFPWIWFIISLREFILFISTIYILISFIFLSHCKLLKAVNMICSIFSTFIHIWASYTIGSSQEIVNKLRYHCYVIFVLFFRFASLCHT